MNKNKGNISKKTAIPASHPRTGWTTEKIKPLRHIAVIAPSSPAPELTEEAITKLKTVFTFMNCTCHLMPHVLDANRFLAGSDKDRADDIMRAFGNEHVHSIMTLKGGYGSNRVLDLLDYDFIAKHPKPFFAFSDGTALQNALFQKSGIKGWTGFQANFFLKTPATIPNLMGALRQALDNVPFRTNHLKFFSKGRAVGQSVGGNLVVLTSLLNTPYFPDLTGKILILEEVNEEPYKVDRMLSQLRLSGAFDKVAGIVLGDFESCIAKDKADGTIHEVLKDYFGKMKIPVAYNLNYGHTPDHIMVPIGETLVLDSASQTLKTARQPRKQTKNKE